MEKVIVFSGNCATFVKSISAYPGPKELFCKYPQDAYDFKTTEKAKEWAEQSGFNSLVVLKLPLAG